MIEKICDILMNRVRQKMPDIDEERAEVIRYGFELIIGEIPKILFTIVLAAILGKLNLLLISLCIICPYRVFSGGVHLKTHIGCFITTNLLYLGNIYISEIISFKEIYMKIIFVILIYIFSVVMILLYAPADTETVPILRKKERQLAKIKSIIWVTIILIISVSVNSDVISNMCIFGILFQTVTITKLIYRIFDVKYGYFEYKKNI